MRMWQVLFDGPKPDPEGDSTLRFVDFHEVIEPENDFTLTPQYVENLQQLVESQTHYTIMGTIKEVHNPEGEDWSHQKVWAVMGLYEIDRAQNAPLGVLIHQLANGDWAVLGLHPPNVVLYPKIPQFVPNVLQAFSQKPDRFFGVNIFTPLRQ
jgi:hypothetical protein